MLVKIAHCLFPKDELNATEIPRGEWIGLHTTHEDVDLKQLSFWTLSTSCSFGHLQLYYLHLLGRLNKGHM